MAPNVEGTDFNTTPELFLLDVHPFARFNSVSIVLPLLLHLLRLLKQQCSFLFSVHPVVTHMVHVLWLIKAKKIRVLENIRNISDDPSKPPPLLFLLFGSKSHRVICTTHPKVTQMALNCRRIKTINP